MREISHLLGKVGVSGGHAKNISAHFDGAVSFLEEERVFDYPLTLLCFTNRSGSNLLAEYLRLSGNFKGLREQLNRSTVQNQAQRHNIHNFPDYVRHCASVMKPKTASFGFKASWDQLLMLFQWNIPAMFSGVNIIHIERLDPVEQAVSFSIANQTKKWTSLTEVEEVEPAYDFKDVLKRLKNARKSNKMVRQIADAYSLERVEVVYEHLVADPNAVCTSSDNLGRLSVYRIGGSGPSLIEITRFQSGGASAA